MLPPRQTRGFVLLRKADKVVAEYNASDIAQKNLVFLEQIRKAVSFLDPRDYRGISREPLLPWSSIDEELLKSGARTLADLKREQKARRKFVQISGEDREQWDHYVDGTDYNKALMLSLDVAKALHGFLDNAEDYEIVEVAREKWGTDYELLGYDIGFWDSGDFSAICDTVVMPRWHAPDVIDLTELADRLRGLNRHVLFDNLEAAVFFREWYVSKQWAEKEGPVGKLCAVQVAAVST